MLNKNLNENITLITNSIGPSNTANIKNFFIGKDEKIDAVIIYIDSLVDKDSISKDILMPLMIHVNESFIEKKNPCEYIAKGYITVAYHKIERDINKISDAIKSGCTVLLIDGIDEAILADTKNREFRAISEPPNETTIKGNHEGFIENLETNISLLRRNIKDSNLTIEYFKVGSRSQTDVVIVYISDIADKDIISEVRTRLNAVDVDYLTDGGALSQYLEDSPYSPFPQVYGTERSDIVCSNILEGRIAVIINRSSSVFTVPGIFVEFFQSAEDYSDRTLNASFSRLLRYLTVFLVLTLPSMYLILIKFNAELIPVKLILPIIQSRNGIYLSPFLEILLMDFVVEFLREGGLRLPPKIATTLSIVGGIIIGNTAVESKIVSPVTLLVIGFTTIATFLIPSYEMSLSIRLIRFPILILSNFLGFLGLTSAWFIILIHLSSLESFKTQYFNFSKEDLKDTTTRAPLWKMNKRPETIPNNNPIRQIDFRKLWRRKNGS